MEALLALALDHTYTPARHLPACWAWVLLHSGGYDCIFCGFVQGES
jgi:hypothetical protein